MLDDEVPDNELDAHEAEQARIASPAASAGPRLLAADLRPEDFRKHWAHALVECVELLAATNTAAARHEATLADYGKLMHDVILGLRDELRDASYGEHGLAASLRMAMAELRDASRANNSKLAQGLAEVIVAGVKKANEANSHLSGTVASLDVRLKTLDERLNKLAETERSIAQQSKALAQAKADQDARFARASLSDRIAWAIRGRIG